MPPALDKPRVGPQGLQGGDSVADRRFDSDRFFAKGRHLAQDVPASRAGVAGVVVAEHRRAVPRDASVGAVEPGLIGQRRRRFPPIAEADRVQGARPQADGQVLLAAPAHRGGNRGGADAVLVADRPAVVQFRHPPLEVQALDAGVEVDSFRLQHAVVYGPPQRAGAAGRVGEALGRGLYAGGQRQRGDVAFAAAIAQRRPLVVDEIERRRPHLDVEGLEEPVVKVLAEAVAVIVAEVRGGRVRTQVGRQLGEVLLDRRRHQRFRSGPLEPDPAVTGDLIQRDPADRDGLVELGEVAMQDVAAEIPGEALGVRDRRCHTADPVAGIHHEIVLAQLGQPGRGAEPGRAGPDDQEARRALHL